MKPLEHRRWFLLVSLVTALASTVASWEAAGLPWRWQGLPFLILASVALSQGLHRALALILIRVHPASGGV